MSRLLFPTVKLLSLTGLWFYPLSDAQRLKAIEWLSKLGRWSMVDVFVLAIMIVLTKTSPLTKAEPRIGLYIFAAAVVLSMVAAMRVEALAKKKALL